MKKTDPGINPKDPKTRLMIHLVLVILFLSLLSLLLISVRANPDNPGDCSCHDSDGYHIETTSDMTIEVEPKSKFTIVINATGSGVTVVFHPDARDNVEFQVEPNDTIADGSEFDLNSAPDEVLVEFSFTAPETEQEYALNIFARSPGGSGMPKLACLEFTILVGDVSNQSPLTQFTWEDFSNHWNIYLGICAVGCCGLGTLLYEYNRELTKAHGWLATIGLSFAIFDTVNVLERTILVLSEWPNYYIQNWAYCSHIIIGLLSIVFGCVAIFTGLGGMRTKIPGYLALGCWSFNLIFGILYWGLYY